MEKASTRWYLRHDSESVIVDAPADVLYDLVADMTRMGDWSPETAKVEWLAGSTGPVVGARFVGHNVTGPFGLMKWSRKGTVLAADRGHDFAFATEEGGREGVVWRYRFQSVDGRTRVTESYEIESIPLWARIADVPTNRAKQLRKGMRHTLGQLKAAAEAVAMDQRPV